MNPQFIVMNKNYELKQKTDEKQCQVSKCCLPVLELRLFLCYIAYMHALSEL
jgi:hypothetical protein